MAFFDQIKDMAKAAAVKSEEFAKTVGKKAEAAMDMQKLSSEIDKKEHFIRDNYMQMGMEIYQKANAGEDVPEYLQEYCKLIAATQAEIDELQTKIDMIKQAEFGASPAKIPCPHCGAEILSSSKFCPECGGSLKQEKASSDNADDNVEKQAADSDKAEAVTDEAAKDELAETEVDKAEQETTADTASVTETADKGDENSFCKAETAMEAEPVVDALKEDVVTEKEHLPENETAKEAEPVIESEMADDKPKNEAFAEAAITDAELVENEATRDTEAKASEVKKDSVEQ